MHEAGKEEAGMPFEDQVKQYKTYGYSICHDFLSESEITEFVREIERISAYSTVAQHDSQRVEMEPHQPPTGRRVRRIYEPCTYYEVFKRFSESPKLLPSLEELLGPDIFYTSSKINVKPAEIGSVVEWHQDMAYGPVTNRSTLSVLVYLDDADRENGCLQVIPGSLPMLSHSRDEVFQGRITEPLDTSIAVHLTGRKGAAIFLNGLVPHASSPNTSSRPRRTLILGSGPYLIFGLGTRTFSPIAFAKLIAYILVPTALLLPDRLRHRENLNGRDVLAMVALAVPVSAGWLQGIWVWPQDLYVFRPISAFW